MVAGTLGVSPSVIYQIVARKMLPSASWAAA